MNQTQTVSRRLADRTAARVAELWAMADAGEISPSEFRRLAAIAVASANAQGVTLADLGITAELIRQRRSAARPLGLRPTATQLDQRRIVRDIDRILETNPAIADTPELLAESRRGRLASWAASEPLLTVATTVGVAMVARGAKGWTRQLVGDNCPKCIDWADGVVRAPGTRMARHPGCDCIQAPTF